MFAISIMPQKIAHLTVYISIAHLENLITESKYIGILARHDLSKVSFPALESSLPFQPATLLINLSTTGWMCSIFSLVKWRGSSRYLIGKDPILQQKSLAKVFCSSSIRLGLVNHFYGN